MWAISYFCEYFVKCHVVSCKPSPPIFDLHGGGTMPKFVIELELRRTSSFPAMSVILLRYVPSNFGHIHDLLELKRVRESSISAFGREKKESTPYSLSHHPPFFSLILTSPSFSYTFARRRKWMQYREIVSGGDTVDTCLVGKKKMDEVGRWAANCAVRIRIVEM